MMTAIEQLAPACPKCGNKLATENEWWSRDCRVHLPFCERCQEPVLAVFSVKQAVTLRDGE